jgi:hypothetical protein
MGKKKKKVGNCASVRVLSCSLQFLSLSINFKPVPYGKMEGHMIFHFCGFWRFHNFVLKDSGLLEFDVVLLGKWLMKFERNVLPSS